MANKVILDQVTEICDNTGQTIGFWLPAKELTQRAAADEDGLEQSVVQRLQTECGRLQQLLAESMQERDSLRHELAKLRSELDLCMKSLYASIKKGFTEADKQELERIAKEPDGPAPAEVLARTAEAFRARKRA